jgi:uracil phosphoribosyltransferase
VPHLGMLNLLPEAHVLHLGLFREKVYNKPIIMYYASQY